MRSEQRSATWSNEFAKKEGNEDIFIKEEAPEEPEDIVENLPSGDEEIEPLLSTDSSEQEVEPEEEEKSGGPKLPSKNN